VRAVLKFMINNNELKNLFEIASKAAKNAGDYLIKRKDDEKKIFNEIGRDIKLEIDRDTEKLIRQELIKTKIPVLGEEFGDDDKSSQYKWVIDPLDGTSNYFRGLDQCCVSIALVREDKALIGIIYNFNNNELFTSFKDGGAYLNNTRIYVSNIAKVENSTLTTGFPASEKITSGSELFTSFKLWKKIRMFGSAALSCAYVASGRCDAYQEKGVHLWDIAAGICLVEEAGGKANYEKIDDSRYSVNFTNGRL